ncbi:threonine synthase [Acidobacteriota bacterium]
MEHLKCCLCGRTYPVNVFDVFCSECQSPLLFEYENQKRELHPAEKNPLEVCREFLPLKQADPSLDIGLSRTPLLKLDRIGETLNLPAVYAKLENMQPTGSFKDRGTSVAVQIAVSIGLKKIGTVSTGNMAASTSAFGAKAGLQTYILVKEDTGIEKILSTGVFGSTVFKTSGDYGELFKKSLEIGKRHGIYFMNSVDPFRIEGYKTLSFELYLQFDRSPPELIFVPVSAGGHLIGLIKAFEELLIQKYIDRIPTFIGVQAEGNSPIQTAFAQGKDRVDRIPKGDTIAHSISNPDPPGGSVVLDKLRRHGGAMLRVSDSEILHAQKLLAEKEGIFCLPASAAALAGAAKYAAGRQMDPGSSEKFVLVVTGTGLKGMRQMDISSMKVINTQIASLDSALQQSD